ncbi:MAG: hypothetical protein NC827_05350 [Candidatus Omnitrophica bacterium]|nr:hypothetical protein [Candidatus Omnitrophota bacterium]MCM8802716.1 hypothetical protein [Candidatus Omnitrophota bacterium]
MDKIELKNGEQSVTFVKNKNWTYSPEWFWEGDTPMLRFKDHEFLNIGFLRIKEGNLIRKEKNKILFGGNVKFEKANVEWSVEIKKIENESGFYIKTKFKPIDFSIEILEGMSFFETPYEYDDQSEILTIISQQPVYYYKNGNEISGAGFKHPFWYYARFGSAHLTGPCFTPLVVNKISNNNGTNPRYTLIIGNWEETTIKDIFVHPTRKNEKKLKGIKFLVGTINWNCSLYKDPNILIEKGKEITQSIIIDFKKDLKDDRLDQLLIEGWERCLKIHFPKNDITSYKIAKEKGISWLNSSKYLIKEFWKKTGIYNPEKGVRVYLKGTRPKWDDGVSLFCGQWISPLSYVGYVWEKEEIIKKSEELEKKFCKGRAPIKDATQTWTIGPTPMYLGAIRKGMFLKCLPETMEIVEKYVKKRTEFILNPPKKIKKGDGGVLVWDAFLSFISFYIFKDEYFKKAGKEIIDKSNKILDEKFWNFNCAAEGDFVGAGQARPFGHAVGISSNILAFEIFKREKYLLYSEKFANYLLSLHFITYNGSPVKDIDTRGWANGSTGGRDQYAQMPPWETEYSLQQLSYLILKDKRKEGFYDLLYLHSHTGFAQFPVARIFKRIYDLNMKIKYVKVEDLITEKQFYQRHPYISYENPWDQTMLAGYQSVEPLILSLFYGDGIVVSLNDKILTLIPQAPVYDRNIINEFIVELWNPFNKPIETRLIANIIDENKCSYYYNGIVNGLLTPKNKFTEKFIVPQREIVRIVFKKKKLDEKIS